MAPPARCNLSKAAAYSVCYALEILEILGVDWDFVDKDAVQADILKGIKCQFTIRYKW